MSDLPDSLAEDERVVRAYAADSGDVILRRHLAAVLREFDRLKCVEKAAAALVEHWGGHITQGPDHTEQDLIADLAQTLNGEKP